MEKINFISRLEPVLKSGEYTFNLKQQAKNKDGASSTFSSNAYSIDKKVLVAGERFRIEEPNIHAVFPPRNNIGDHSNALPQVVLNRATLPWERGAMSEDETVPWMMVIVLYESELIADKTELLRSQKVADYINFGVGNVIGKITLPKEIGQDENELIDVLKIDTNLAGKLIPLAQELKLLTSVRDNKQGSEVISSQWATCFSNRLPAIGEKSVAYLVSMERRYKADGKFDYSNGTIGDATLFTCLANWSFSCPDEQEFEWNNLTKQKLASEDLNEIKVNTDPVQTVSSYLENKLNQETLYRGLVMFKTFLPKIFDSDSLVSKTNQQKILNCLKSPTKTFEGILNKVNRGDFKLNVPSIDGNEYAQPYLKRSSTVLPHHLRGGEQTASWYHGPLISGKDTKEMDLSILPIRSSDILYQYDESINMLDVSYASAWELGRLLMLNNNKMAKSLFTWKQVNAAKLLEAEQDIARDHLPFTDKYVKANSIGENLNQWFNNLNLLHGVPLNYLVPDENLLPIESIRFFEIDNYWIDCLMDGAFSIGRVTNTDNGSDRHFREVGISPKSDDSIITGFLLRSEVVSGWPSLLVDGYAKKQTHEAFEEEPLTILRQERISPTLLICLFSGKAETIDLHLKAESLHMGYDFPAEENLNYYKKLRYASGDKIGEENGEKSEITWKCGEKRIIDISTQIKNIMDELKEPSIDNLNAGQFALEMIVGVPRVRFNITT